MEQIEKAWVKSENGPSAMIPEKSVEAINCIRNVFTASPVDQVNFLVGVQMTESKAIFSLWVRVCHSRASGQAQYPEHQDYRGNTTPWISVCSHALLLSQQSAVSQRPNLTLPGDNLPTRDHPYRTM
jgi:hypothetical protein